MSYNKGNSVIINLCYDGKVNTNRLENLVIKFQQTGSDESFAELYAEYSQNILQYLQYLTNNNAADIQDLSQDIWIKVIHKRNSLKTPSAFKQWLYRIAKTSYINHFNKNKNDKIEYGNDFENTAISEEEIDSFINEENKSQVQEIISTLPEEKKTILWLRTVEGYSHKEIASILKIPDGTVRSRLHNIIEDIKHILKKGEIK